MAMVVCDVRNGSLISQDDRTVVEKIIGRDCEWKEIPGTRQEAGAFFQAEYSAEINQYEVVAVAAEMANDRLQHTIIV